MKKWGQPIGRNKVHKTTNSTQQFPLIRALFLNSE